MIRVMDLADVLSGPVMLSIGTRTWSRLVSSMNAHRGARSDRRVVGSVSPYVLRVSLVQFGATRGFWSCRNRHFTVHLQAGQLVCVEYGDLATQFLGWGGIRGGGIFVSGGVSRFRAASFQVLPLSLSGSHPPPYQNPD